MRIATLVCLALLLLAAPASARPTAIVAMGDSFISGEGGRWLGNGSEALGTRSGTDRAAYRCDALGCDYDPARIYGTSEADDCHRSDVAPIESAPIAVEAKVNLACSGARARDLRPGAEGGTGHFGEPPEADQLAAVARRYRVRMVVVTVGANDVGFGGLVAECALDWARSPADEAATCHAGAEAAIQGALSRARREVTAALRGVRRTLRAASYAPPDYRLVAMGYASPFPEGRWFRYPEDGWSRLREGGCPVWDADADWAADRATGDLGGMLAAAAAASGAEYLDLGHAFDGHQLCDRRARRVGPAGPSPLTAEWFRRLSFLQGATRESLHPNAYGQRVIGTCLALLFARARGDYSCADTPGEWLDGLHLTGNGRAPDGGSERGRPDRRAARSGRPDRRHRRVRPTALPVAPGKSTADRGSHGARRRSLHQLDAVAAGGDREGAGLAPVLAAAFDLEAVLLQAGEGGVDLGADDGEVGAGRDHRLVLVHEVDLGAGALDPGEAAVEGVGDDGEAEDREELEGAVEVGGLHLDAGVLEHQREWRLGRLVYGSGPRARARLMPRRPRSPSTR
ncbi:MAG TPA: GDSL-type esterase/lipase family protein [Solirubrobacterales bacterium]|nr:GDSL-type esterase/lipase family protein [Solirubrobacterales bacterium]